jgi:hypothetical protein
VFSQNVPQPKHPKTVLYTSVVLHTSRHQRRRESAPYDVANPRQVFNLAAVCALSGTDFVALFVPSGMARSKDKCQAA